MTKLSVARKFDSHRKRFFFRFPEFLHCIKLKHTVVKRLCRLAYGEIFRAHCLKALVFILGAGIFTSSILTACSRETYDDCFSNTGPQITRDRPSGGFNKIELYDNVNLVIIPGTTSKITVEAGEHILDALTTEISDSTLVIHNTMTCNWVRNYDKELTVYATVPDLTSIRYEGSGDIRTEGQLTTDSLRISVWGGAGTFNLNLDVTKLNMALHYGTVDFHVSGKSLITTIFSNSYGPFYCDSLISNIVYIRSSGSNNCYVRAVHVLEAEITSVGDIYYSGNPYQVSQHISGSGKLIKTE